MAEFIFKRMVDDAGLTDKFEIISRATSAEELGNPVYPPARTELMRHGLSCEGKYAVQLTRSDYEKYNLFIGMDNANIRNMHRLFGGDPEGKITRLMDYTGRGGEVSDPWYSGKFDITYRDVHNGCAALLEKLRENM